MRLTTWNINSVRLRIGLMKNLVKARDPDVICLQETKTPDDAFPHKAFEELGFVHRHIQGMKGYNGVAIVSKRPFADAGTRDWVGRQDCRHCFVVFEDGVEVHNFYIPAGGDEPDPEKNDKFAHKLQFLEDLCDWWRDRRHPDLKSILAGDFNIAPSQNDVWSHTQLRNTVSHTEPEITRLAAFRRSGDFIDAVRKIHPEPEKLYSWWSYRAKDWRKSNRGRRLDHIWVTPALADAVTGAEIDLDARDWIKPSDHVPVTVTLAD